MSYLTHRAQSQRTPGNKECREGELIFPRKEHTKWLSSTKQGFGERKEKGLNDVTIL